MCTRVYFFCKSVYGYREELRTFATMPTHPFIKVSRRMVVFFFIHQGQGRVSLSLFLDPLLKHGSMSSASACYTGWFCLEKPSRGFGWGILFLVTFAYFGGDGENTKPGQKGMVDLVHIISSSPTLIFTKHLLGLDSVTEGLLRLFLFIPPTILPVVISFLCIISSFLSNPNTDVALWTLNNI